MIFLPVLDVNVNSDLVQHKHQADKFGYLPSNNMNGLRTRMQAVLQVLPLKASIHRINQSVICLLM